MNKLKLLRAEKELTVRELAELSNVAPATINRLERGKIKSHAPTIAKLAKALGVPLSELADLINDKPDESAETENKLVLAMAGV